MKITLALVLLLINCALFEAFHGALSIIGISVGASLLIESLSEALKK